ncbi:SRPBCC family protein [Dactylosporangium sp. NPDC049140]|uniref:SRPBCC family protein n=1 Tax=Dactylosporangium sp. NPDC049140 TaxID=3155647 RepID=UPI0033EA1F27
MTDPELVETGPRPAVHLERTYDHPIERVWRAVTTPEHLAQWFPTEATMDLRPGGRIRFGDLGDGGSEGEVVAVEPPHRLDFLWGDQRFEFRLEPAGAGTRFTLVHHFDDRAGAASFASGWETCMRALSAVLAGAQPPPPGRAVARHEELVSRFGLDRPEVTRDAGGWHVRFERQLTCPAERAWSIFFGGGDAPGAGEAFHPFAAPGEVLGTVVAADTAKTFVFDTAAGEPGTQVRLHLGPGTGHGARLVLEVDGTDESEIGPAIDQWGGGAIAHVAREAAASNG